MNRAHAHWNPEREALAPEAFRDVQERALAKQLDYVFADSEFYRAKLADAGAERGDIRTLEDLARLPFTDKQELRDSQSAAPPLGRHIACDMAAVKRIYSTSGTTGRPTYIGLTEHDIGVWREAHCRALWTCGLRPGDIVPLTVSPFVIAASFADALQAIGTEVPIGIGATDRLIDAFRCVRATALLCTSSFPMHFASALERRGIDPGTLGLKLIMAGGEPGAAIPSVRSRVEAAFGCRFLEMAGNGDMCGLIWSECAHQQGMHFIAQGLVHTELIDPDSGAVQDIELGAKGELVYTSLDRECIPLLRFRTGDHAIVTQTACQCGRTGVGIRIVGRTDDMLIVQGVNVYPSAVQEIVASLAPRTTGAIEIQIPEPPPEGWKPPVRIKVEHAGAPEPGLAEELETLIRDKLIFRSRIELVEPGTLPRFEYKARLVRNLYD